MAGINSLIEFLVTDDWRFEDIKSFLERDHSSINDPDNLQRSPLFYVLKSSKCSRDIVRLLLQYGASINKRNKFGESPLLFALEHVRDATVIIELIEKGANVDVQDEKGNTPLCLAFRNRLSTELVESLLKAGCSLQACKKHGMTVWHCFTYFGLQGFESGFTEGVTKLLIEAGADVLKVDNDGRSPLCHMLFEGAGVACIKVLLCKGASFNNCKKHNSPLLCVTDGSSAAILKSDVIRFLLNEDASVVEVSEQECTPLQLALLYCRYEMTTIQILIDLACKDKDIVGIKHESLGNLLHFAASNPDCKLNIVKYLLDKGVRSDEINKFGQTPLHKAMRGDRRDLRIIELLVKNGSPVNVKCHAGHTPLSLAVENQMQCNVLYVLLEAGAFIEGVTDRFGVPLLEQTLEQYYGIDRSKILLKWLLIENPSFHIRGLIESHYGNAEFTSFAEECTLHLQRMKTVKVGHDLTLSEFIKEYLPQNVGDYKPKLNFDLDQLLRAISIHQFRNFYDVISSKIGKLLLMEKLQQLSVYSLKHWFDYPCIEPKVVCHYDCLWKIAKYLTKKDLLCFVLAFYFTCDYVINHSIGFQ